MEERRERRVNRVLVVAVLVAVVLGVAAGGYWLLSKSGGFEPECHSYAFDVEVWRTDGSSDATEHEAEAIAECGALAGLTRGQVRDLLGPQPPHRSARKRQWEYAAGWVNDGIGPGDGQIVYVHFDAADRVRRASLAYPQ